MTYNSYSYKRGVTGFYQESQNPLCLVVTRIVVYKNKLHINLHIYYVFEDKFKYPKIIKIQQVHQEIHAKQFFYFI